MPNNKNMEFTYENQGSYSYLVYEVQADDIVDTLSLGMITNNKITGLATVLYTQMDDKKYIKYNISAKVSAAQFFEGIVNKKQLLSIFSSIVSTLMTAEEYMIDVNSFVLDMNYLYTDVTSYETVLICLPIMDMSQRPVNYCSFFKDIMFDSKFDQTENYDYIARIINYLNSTTNFSFADFRKLIMELSGNTSPIPPVSVPSTMVLQAPLQMLSAVQNNVPPLERPLPGGTQGISTKPETGRNTMNTMGKENSGMNYIPSSANEVKGMAIPGASGQKEIPPVNAGASQKNEDGKRISMFNLLSHYNKENAALYKEQKQREKEQKAAEKNLAAEKKKKEKNKNTKAAGKNSKQIKFEIPGQQTSITTGQQQNGMSMPGQQNTEISSQQALSQQSVTGGNFPVQASGNINQGMQVSGNYMQGMQAAGNGYQTGFQTSGQGTQEKSNFGETTVLNMAFGETVVLKNGMQQTEQHPYLLRIKNNEKILLNKPVFRIGKEKSYVDYFIGDNAAISRSHANILVKESGCFIVDTNSTNHTYINGRMIQSNLEAPILSGDKITLANEDFEMCYGN